MLTFFRNQCNFSVSSAEKYQAYTELQTDLIQNTAWKIDTRIQKTFILQRISSEIQQNKILWRISSFIGYLILHDRCFNIATITSKIYIFKH